MNDKYSSIQERLGALCGAIFLFGLAFLFRYDRVWPGILPLILITALPLAILESGLWFGLWILVQTAIWLIGLPLLIMSDFIWPGILVLGGMSALVVAIAPPDKLQARGAARRHQRVAALTGEKSKRKRGLPVPPSAIADDPDDEDAASLAASLATGDDHRHAGRDRR
jgi:hypothetical protein